MRITPINIEEVITHRSGIPVLDVRSPGEYTHAHIPGAHSLPLFTDEERAIIGTTYKVQGQQKAIKYGLDFFGSRMRKMVEEVESLMKKIGYREKQLVVHCWRGGMRSEAVAWLLQLYGYEVFRIEGGYKSYRRWVLEQFDRSYNFRVLGGYTGSGKSVVLRGLSSNGHTTIDLEGIANHKGSAFGGIGMPQQPKQEMFENILALELLKKANAPIWVEDESQRIGNLNIPNNLWCQLRSAPLFFLNIPFEERLKIIVDDYGALPQEDLVNSVLRIQKKLGPNESKITINLLLENNITEAFRILLSYYDKLYKKGLYNRTDTQSLLTEIVSETADPDTLIHSIQSLFSDGT